MTQIISPDNLSISLRHLREKHDNLVLAGGCFDILHIGHVRFLLQAKHLGKTLVILLESDKTVGRLKGNNRPYFNQQERAEMLSQLRPIDIVVCLPPITDDDLYITLVEIIHPHTIAVTQGDRSLAKKQQQAAKIGATIAVIPHINTHSTSSLAHLLGVE